MTVITVATVVACNLRACMFTALKTNNNNDDDDDNFNNNYEIINKNILSGTKVIKVRNKLKENCNKIRYQCSSVTRWRRRSAHSTGLYHICLHRHLYNACNAGHKLHSIQKTSETVNVI